VPHRRFVPYAVVVSLTTALYIRTAGYGFVFDDTHLIVNNSFLRAPWSPFEAFAHHFWHGTAFGAAYYRPIVISSLALNGRLFGWGAAGFHVVNVLLHAVNAGLVLALARRLGHPGPAALSAALLFALHPVAAWPVASIVARVDLLAALFVLLAWLATEADATGPAGGEVSARRHGALLAGSLFFLALLSKESALAFLAVPVLGLRRMKEARSGWEGAAACGFAVLIWVAIRRWLGIGILPDRSLIDPLTNPLAQIPFPERFWAALALAGRYLLYLVFPVRFTDPVDYFARSTLPHPGSPGVILGLVVLLVWGGSVLALWIRRDRIALPLAFSLASYLPASNLLAPISSLYAQNFLYMPLVGVSLAVGDLLGRTGAAGAAVSPSGTGRTGVRLTRPVLVVAAALLLLAAASSVESGIWRDDLSLFGAWTERFPVYAMAHSGLGVAFLGRGDPERAIRPLRRALELTDRSTEAHYNLGVALLAGRKDSGDLQEALVHLHRSLELAPGLAPARAQASRAYLLLHRPSEAEREAREALRLSPGFAPAMLDLAEALYQEARYGEAADLFGTLVSWTPTDVGLRTRQIDSLIRAGEQARAEAAIREARRLFPRFQASEPPNAP